MVPAILALIIGFAMFKRRVGGVYFAIITQAVAAILAILIVGQQGFTGGINGITDLKTLHGWDIRTDSAHRILYYVNAALLLGSALVCYHLSRSKLGRLLLAMRDREDRVRFSGYDVANLKTFVFVFAAILAAIGGAMFTLQVGFMSPSFVGIVPSIEMVVSVALGGRDWLLGAIYGTLVVNFGKTFFSEQFPQMWLIMIGGLFIGVVMVFPAAWRQSVGPPSARSCSLGGCDGPSGPPHRPSSSLRRRRAPRRLRLSPQRSRPSSRSRSRHDRGRRPSLPARRVRSDGLLRWLPRRG